MKKSRLIYTCVFLWSAVLFRGAGFALAEGMHDHHMMGEPEHRMTLADLKAAPSANSDGTVNLNNEMCPVSGDKVSGKHTFLHEGIVYNMCCNMCAGKFEKNPENFAFSIDEVRKVIQT